MKRFLPLFLTVLTFSAPAWPQEIFDALRKRDVQAVKALIEKSPSVLDSRDGDGMTPLHYAVMGDDAAFIHYLLDKGAKLELQDARATTPLLLAAMNDRTEAAKVLIKRGADLEKRDDYARTALILCARERGQAATARVLLDAGARIDAADKFGGTALGLAAWRGKREFVDLLLERGAAVPESGEPWRRLLSLSASQGLSGLFRRLTDKGQDLKAMGVSGETLLHAAAQGGASEIVGALLERGFDPGRKDVYGWTPLHYAALDGRIEAARKLVEHGAPLDSPTIAGQTPYSVARERGMKAVAELLAEKGAGKGDAGFPVLVGDHLGQKPPSGGAERFALGIVSSIWGLHSTAVFSPDGKEVYWAPMMTFPGEIYSRGGLLMMKRVNGRWTAPAWASFSGPDFDDDVPFFSTDGKRIFFISRRPLADKSDGEKERIWFADRTPAGWSEPRPIDAAVNDQDMHWQFSLDRQGNLYLASQIPGGLGSSDIYCARSAGGKYGKPVNLGKPINSADGENTPFIAPDGSYLLFSRQYDLWVSFRGTDNTWSEPVKLGPEVNGPSIELCPVVTADSKYLFFLSQRDGESHAYWVSADVIEKARPKTGQESGPSQGNETGAAKPESFRRVEIRDTEMRFLESKYVNQTYEIDVSFPKDYGKETARYPVLYVLDAEYNFGCVAYIARRLIKNGDIPKVLVVGIAYNTTEGDFYAQRERDCTPPSEVHGDRSGGVENFIRFFENELVPYVDGHFRTIAGDRTIVGHSIGGFFCTYALFKHPGLFDKYLIVSPSLWYSNEIVFEYEKEFAGTQKAMNAAVFLSTGKDESEQMVRTTDRMVRTIAGRNYSGLRFESLLPEGEHHRSIFPYAYTKGLRWLFKSPR